MHISYLYTCIKIHQLPEHTHTFTYNTTKSGKDAAVGWMVSVLPIDLQMSTPHLHCTASTKSSLLGDLSIIMLSTIIIVLSKVVLAFTASRNMLESASPSLLNKSFSFCFS